MPTALPQRVRQRDELEFLPALLEIQQTPPLPAARWLLRTLMLFLVTAAVWSGIGRVDVVATASGRTIPGGRVKIIQPLDPGVIRAIHVRDGDSVTAGQPLIELDATQPAADLRQLQREALALQADRARLEVLLDASRDTARAEPGGPAGAEPSETALQSRLPPGLDLQQSRLAIERMMNEWREYQSGLETIDEEKSQRRAEYAVVVERIRQLDATLPLIAERAGAAKQLQDRHLAPRMQWLELEQQRVEQSKERDIQVRQLDVLEAAGAGLDRERAARVAGFRQKVTAELEQAERRLAALELESLKAEERIALLMLTAPVAGTVQRLAVHTQGGVVTPAQELMQIVPAGDPLEVEAWILNRDIGYLRKGQAAAIKIETFPFTKYGTIDGELLDISRDAIPDERLGPVYSARVGLARQSMSVNGVEVPLTAGMSVTVELKLGSRRIIEFLLNPLLRYRDEAFRER